MSLFGQVIGGSLVVYCPIWERGVAEVCIDTRAMVYGMVAELDENRVARLWWRSSGVLGASVLSVP